MSGLWRQCCPDCGEVTCAEMCDEKWEDSYALTNLSGSFTYSKTQAINTDCLCKGQSIDVFVRNWTVTVNWVQEVAIVITRQGPVNGQCCYYGEGNVTVSATVVIDEFLICCDDSEIVSTTTEITRSDFEVPVCVSLTCGDGVDECQPLTPGAKMTLNVCMCDFPLQGSVQLSRPVPNEPCGYEIEPDDEIGLVMGGICWFYEARLIRPDLMVGGDRSLGGLCSTALAACDVYGSTQGDLGNVFSCMPCVRFDQTVNGPFALYAVEPFTLGVDDPGTCSCPGGEAIVGVVKSLVDCSSNPAENCSPCVSTSVDTDCCEIIVGKDLRWPVFT